MAEQAHLHSSEEQKSSCQHVSHAECRQHFYQPLSYLKRLLGLFIIFLGVCCCLGHDVEFVEEISHPRVQCA